LFKSWDISGLDCLLFGLNSPQYFLACKSIALELEEKDDVPSNDVLKIIRKISSKYHLSSLPKNEDIIEYLSPESKYRRILMVRPVKTASGVAVIAVMPKPFECPHGRCIYCPGGIEDDIPLSYVGTEPSTKLAQEVLYDPYEQITSKLKKLSSLGHHISKVELVIVGGTFPFMPEGYQRNFVKSCYDALSSFGSDSGPATNLEQAVRINETSQVRCVGLTVETKPDYCKRKHVTLMLELGVTRIEIGVQSLHNEAYHIVNRGHTLDDVIQSFQIAKDAGYKIVAHMMPGLPSSSPEKDIDDFKRLFYDPLFKPDMVKIYPTLVLRGTALFNLYSQGKYSAYSDDDLINLLVEVKKMVPPWVRIMRIQREIESKDIVAGPKYGNLRQMALRKLQSRGLKCKCIRCREIGLQMCKSFLREEDIVLSRLDYFASNGQEVFLTFESKDKSVILGFLRLRRISECQRMDFKIDRYHTSSWAIIRELHVYGQLLDIGKRSNDDSYQHRGYGSRLITEAERIVREEFDIKSVSVISAVGTREYYKRLGYIQDGPYVSKTLC
jgi:elongator complex protein 3